MITAKDYEEFATKTLNYPTREFYRNGALHEQTLLENERAFSRLRIRPRFLNRDVSKRDLSANFLGNHVSCPIGVAPTAMQKLAHPDGEAGSARACEKAGVVFILSTISNTSLEDVTKS